MQLSKYFEMLKFSAASAFSFFRKKRVPDVWLIGENLGKSNDDNGFCFFEYVLKNSSQKVFFLIDGKREVPQKLWNYQDSLLVINSWKHYFYYFKTKYCIVSHGVRDAVPHYIVFNKKNHIKPIIYLQHGIIKYKKIYFNKLSYNKSILRFLASSQDEKQIITTSMMPRNIEHDLAFVRWQLTANDALVLNCLQGECDKEIESISEFVSRKGYRERLANKLDFLESKVGIDPSRVPVTGLPRHDYLLKAFGKINVKRKILIFPTWRERLVRNDLASFVDSEFYKKYYCLVTSRRFLSILEKNNFEAVFFPHVEMSNFLDAFKAFESQRVSVSTANFSLREEILESSVLITDYSSVAWEFSVLNKKTIFYHFDYDEYFSHRGTYAKSSEDWSGEVAHTKDEVLVLLEEEINKTGFEDSKVKEQYGLVADGSSCRRVFEEVNSIPPKVYFAVYNIYGFGGTVKTVINTANYLYRKGYDVEIISIRRTSNEPKLGLNPGVKIRPLYDARRNVYVKDKGNLKWVKNFFVRVLRKFPSVLVHKNEELYSMLTLYTDFQLLRHFYSLKDGVLVTTMPSLNWLSSKIVSKNVFKIGQEHRTYYDHDQKLAHDLFVSYKRLDLLTVLTEKDFDDFSTNIPGLNVIVQGNGTSVDNDLIAPEYESTKIVSLGRLVSYKGYDLLIEAFYRISDQYPTWSLEIYGRGIEKHALIGKVEELGLEDKVHIFDPVSDIDTVLRSASIFALPSRVESFGMVILEAGASGLPVVGFDKPYGPKTLINNGKDGFLATAFDVDDYARMLSKLMSDAHLRRKMGQAAHKKVLNEYSIDVVGKRFENMLNY